MGGDKRQQREMPGSLDGGSQSALMFGASATLAAR